MRPFTALLLFPLLSQPPYPTSPLKSHCRWTSLSGCQFLSPFTLQLRGKYLGCTSYLSCEFGGEGWLYFLLGRAAWADRGSDLVMEGIRMPFRQRSLWLEFCSIPGATTTFMKSKKKETLTFKLHSGGHALAKQPLSQHVPIEFAAAIYSLQSNVWFTWIKQSYSQSLRVLLVQNVK